MGFTLPPQRSLLVSRLFSAIPIPCLKILFFNHSNFIFVLLNFLKGTYILKTNYSLRQLAMYINFNIHCSVYIPYHVNCNFTEIIHARPCMFVSCNIMTVIIILIWWTIKKAEKSWSFNLKLVNIQTHEICRGCWVLALLFSLYACILHSNVIIRIVITIVIREVWESWYVKIFTITQA